MGFTAQPRTANGPKKPLSIAELVDGQSNLQHGYMPTSSSGTVPGNVINNRSM